MVTAKHLVTRILKNDSLISVINDLQNCHGTEMNAGPYERAGHRLQTKQLPGGFCCCYYFLFLLLLLLLIIYFLPQ